MSKFHISIIALYTLIQSKHLESSTIAIVNIIHVRFPKRKRQLGNCIKKKLATVAAPVANTLRDCEVRF